LLRGAGISAGRRPRRGGASLSNLTAQFEAHSVNARAPRSELRIQFTTDERYQDFLSRAVDAEVLGIRVKVACRRDVTRGTLWASAEPHRQLSKRKKDELDLIRLAEA
jgi:hypothetical protein